MVARLNKVVLQPKGDGHDSDCATHNMPASPNGPCNCSASRHETEYALRRHALIAEPARREEQRAQNAAMSDTVAALDDKTPLEVGGPLPKAIGLCADLYSDVRALRLMMEKEVERVQARETEIKNHIIENLSKSDDTGAAGKRYRAQIVVKEVPKIADWTKLTQYILENDRFDLVQKRLGEKAVTDMWESGVAVPGVEKMNIPNVSITKI